MGRSEEYEGKKYLMVGDNILDKVVDKIKEITGIEKFDDSKILIDTDDQLPDDIIFKNEILFARVIKDDDRFCLQIFLKEPVYDE